MVQDADKKDLTQEDIPANIDDCYVRRYMLKDIDAISKLVCAQVPLMPEYRTVTIDPSRVTFLLTNNLTNEGVFMARVLCDSNTDTVRGCLFASCDSPLFSWDKIASVSFIVFDPAWRTQFNTEMLINIFVKWARLRNPKSIQLLRTEDFTHPDFNCIGNLFEYNMEKAQ